MHIANTVRPKILSFRPPRIALSLLLLATLAELATPGTWGNLGSLPIAGAVIGLTGFLIMMRAWWLFRIHDVAICPTSATRTLITGDIYKLTRNPMYLGLILMILSLAFLTGSVFYVAAAVIFFLVINYAFCPYEEEKLRSGFKETYEAYAGRVRRWL